MAKRNSIKVNIDEMFLPNTKMDDDKLRKEAVRSPTWPIAVAIYGATEGRVRVADFIAPLTHSWGSELDMQHYMTLTTVHGFSVANIKYDPRPKDERSDDETAFTIQAVNNNFRDTNKYGFAGEKLCTNTQRYAVQKMAKGRHDVHHSICSAVLTIEQALSDHVRSILDNAMDVTYGSSLSGRPTVTIPREYSQSLLKVFMGDADKSSIPFNMMDKIRSLYTTMKQSDEKFDSALATVRSMLEGEKIVFFPQIRGGVIVGKTNTVPISAALDMYRDGSSLPYVTNFAYMPEVGFSMPLRWYKSLQDLPSDLRKELEIQLVMLKAHIGSDNLVPTDDDMRDKKFWPEIGAACRKEASYTSPMFILNSMNVA
jgi:hypothetical protein